MKSPLVLVLAASAILALAACSLVSNPSDERCNEAWNSLALYQRMQREETIYEILNMEHPPDTVGDLLQRCIRRGWQPEIDDEVLELLAPSTAMPAPQQTALEGTIEALSTQLAGSGEALGQNETPTPRPLPTVSP